MEVAAAVSGDDGGGGGGSSSSLLLPDDMVMEVLLRLPVRPILRFRAVCRSWAALISTEEFCSLHMATAAAKTGPSPQKLLFVSPRAEVYSCRCSPASGPALEEEGVELLFTIELDSSMQVLTPASCHGLTLLYDPEPVDVGPAYYVCNASTRAVTRLPPCANVYICSTGLGFDARTRKYKVVRLITEQGFDVIRCEVYTHGGGGHGDRRWRPAAGEVPLALRRYAASAVLNSAANNLPPVFSNGFLHWLFIGPPSPCAVAVVSFSLADETFSSVIPPFFWSSQAHASPLPTNTYSLDRKEEHLVDMDNQLCMVRVLRPSPDGGCAVEIWKSPDCGNSSASCAWSMKHRIDLSTPSDFRWPLVVRVVGFTGNGSSGKKKMIIATTNRHMISAGTVRTNVHIYDLSSQALKTILSVTDQIYTSTERTPSSRFSLFQESLACIN